MYGTRTPIQPSQEVLGKWKIAGPLSTTYITKYEGAIHGYSDLIGSTFNYNVWMMAPGMPKPVMLTGTTKLVPMATVYVYIIAPMDKQESDYMQIYDHVLKSQPWATSPSMARPGSFIPQEDPPHHALPHKTPHKMPPHQVHHPSAPPSQPHKDPPVKPNAPPLLEKPFKKLTPVAIAHNIPPVDYFILVAVIVGAIILARRL